MSKFCPICNEYTNCTDNCKSCLEEEQAQSEELLEDLHLEQLEQM